MIDEGTLDEHATTCTGYSWRLLKMKRPTSNDESIDLYFIYTSINIYDRHISRD